MVLKRDEQKVLPRVIFEVSPSVLERIDLYSKREDYANRSDWFRDLVRRWLRRMEAKHGKA